MNSRYIFPLLIAGALAFACGPRSRTDSGSLASVAKAATTNVVTTKPVERPKKSTAATKDAKLDSRLKVEVQKKEVRFAFDVTNTGGKHVELSFPCGKSYDIVVYDSLGREVWHWSDGRMFTQGVQNKQL